MAVEGGDAGRNPTYYADNFDRILDTVAARYGDLLTAAEHAFRDDLRALSLAARCLYVRLVSRVGPYFRRDDLRYEEIPDPAGAIEELAAAGLLDLAPGAEPAALLPHLLRAEIEEIAALPPRRDAPAGGVGVGEQLACPPLLPTRATKTERIEALCAACDPATLRDAILRRVPLIAPLRAEHVTLHRLLFFGNLRQDESELVLADLGVWRYESYTLARELRLFPTRAAIDDALAVRALREEIRRSIERGDGDAAWRGALAVARRDPPWHPTSRAIADAVLLEVAHRLERAPDSFGAADGARAGEQALALYSACFAPPARERCARLHARLGRERRAIALCREIAAAPRDESERLFAPRFEQRLRRGLGQVPPARRRYRRARRLLLRPDRDRAVEDLALDHYAALGQHGFHAENWLWLSLFGLAFWDVVFAPVAGAFEHAYQDAPLDLEEPAFRARRDPVIRQRIDEIGRSAWPADRLLGVWDAKQGLRNRLVPWAPAVRTRLELALSRLQGSHLAAVLDRLSRDLGRYRRGLPDLFLLAPGEPGYVLLEVKGPGDRLRPEQVGWLDYLADCGLPCGVLAVEWTGAAAASRAERSDSLR